MQAIKVNRNKLSQPLAPPLLVPIRCPETHHRRCPPLDSPLLLGIVWTFQDNLTLGRSSKTSY